MPELLHLIDDWQICAVDAGRFGHPAELEAQPLQWIQSRAGTAAAAMRDAGLWSLDSPERRFDAQDWWYRATFDSASIAATLRFEGLATLADAWLNGHHLLTSDNMFVRWDCPVVSLLSSGNQLIVRFRSVDDALRSQRPRPRWRVPMMENQQLRWLRTTVLGRTPGWSPPCASVGLWRPVTLCLDAPLVSDIQWQTQLDGRDGLVRVRCRAPAALQDTSFLTLSGHGSSFSAPLLAMTDGTFAAEIRIASPHRWWPHTHGEPARYEVALHAVSEAGANEEHRARIGFRTVNVDCADGRFVLSVNGVQVFCRGACWTPIDPVTLHVGAKDYEQVLNQVRLAGMNMLRVGGTMVYESDEFYELCDELGILLWHDFMFANMDYPGDDDWFVRSVTREANQFLARISHRPSLAVLCGNSEVEQQAAMWGAPRELWTPPLFHQVLKRLSAQYCPLTTYWPSSAHGGAFPHAPDTGTASYYGVGAYLRPLTDARMSEIQFASECLAFANVPEPATLRAMPEAGFLRVHGARWKQRSPRDRSAGWDFDDVRDHYIRELFRVDPLQVRYADHERYLELGRIATLWVMGQAFAEWRREHSRCAGALVWFLRDLWQGAGWGVIAADGLPKSPWYELRRTLGSPSVSIEDAGCNGLMAHLVSESRTALTGELEIALWRYQNDAPTRHVRAVDLPPHGHLRVNLGEGLSHFSDLSHAYRFGPPSHDLVVATLRTTGNAPARATFFPGGLSAHQEVDVGLTATARMQPSGDYVLHLSTPRVGLFIGIDVPGYEAADAYFHLLPGEPRDVALARRRESRHAPHGVVSALNSRRSANVKVVL